MENDKNLQHRIIEELAWEPSLDAAHIGVIAQDGVVTLTGHVGSYVQKIAAERVAKRVRGVRAIAQEIEVRWPSDPKTSDDQIAERLTHLLDWDALVPRESVQVRVEKGSVTLLGNVDWQYQKNAAQQDAAKISGVREVSNLIELRPTVTTSNVRAKIEAALERHADLEAAGITVRLDGSKVVLGGKVRAGYEREIAERAAWSAPGVTQVEDHIALA